ncbi:MAG: hypothetical protein WCW56_00505 [Candidatus Paceibacterota bacterium]|jgi:hypothetical protein
MIDQQKAKEAYDSFIEKAENDGRIIGIILSGGRGKDAQSENSDYDVILITTDEGFDSVKQDYPKSDFIDSLPHAISEFRDYAKSGTRSQYDKYTFTHNKAVLDKTGEIQKLVDDKGALEPDFIKKAVHDALGGYQNSLHRALKNTRDGNVLAGLLDASETIPRILNFIFALEGRVRPFNKFLAWELDNYPLEKLPMESKDLLLKIETIAKTGDVEIQKEILAMIRQMAIANGFSEEIADWDGYYFG